MDYWGTVVAIDPRDALSRGLTAKLPNGVLVGEAFAIPVDVIQQAPGNFDADFATKAGNMEIAVVRSDNPSMTLGNLIAQALPGIDEYERGYKDALESVVLAAAEKVSEPLLDEVLTTALDAYANNVDEDACAQYERPSS